MPLEMHPSMSSGFSLWSVTAALLTVMMSFWCFANLQNSLLLVICKGTWVLKLCWCSMFSKIYCKSTAGQTGQHPGYLVLLPKAMLLEKLREAISVNWKRRVGMCKNWLNPNKRIYFKKKFALFAFSTHGSTSSLCSKQQQNRVTINLNFFFLAFFALLKGKASDRMGN